MGFFNHPLLCTSVPVDNGLSATESGWTCSAVTAGNNLSFNPKTANAQLVVGDLVLALIVARKAKNGSTVRPPSDWNGFCYRAGGTAFTSGQYETTVNAFIFWKFYVAGDDKTHDFAIDVDDTYCYNVVGVRGASKKMPFPHVLSVLTGQSDNLCTAHGFHVPPLQTGNDFGNLMLWYPVWDGDTSGTHVVAPVDFDPATSGAYVGQTSSPPTLHFETYYYNEGGGHGAGQGLYIYKDAPRNLHQNYLGNSAPAQISGSITYTPNGTLKAGVGGSDFDNSTHFSTSSITVEYDSTTSERYIEYNFEATTGDKINVLMRMWGALTSSRSMVLIPSIIAPDGSKMSGVRANGSGVKWRSASADYTSFSGLTPEYIWGDMHQSSSAFEDPCPFIGGFGDTATQTGTHKLRVYIAREGDADVSYNPGSGGTISTGCAIDYLAVGINGMPSEISCNGTPRGTGTGNAMSRDMTVPFLFATDLEYTWFPPSGSEGDRKAHILASIGMPAYETWQAPMLYGERGNWGVTQRHASDTGWLSMISAGTPILPGNAGPDLGTYNFWKVDRAIYPNYYATEDASSPTDGKYYWEVTVDEIGAGAGTGWRVGFVEPMVAHSRGMNSAGGGLAIGAGGQIIHYDGPGLVTTLGSGLSNGDVVGFAVNYNTDAVDIYVNGSSVYSTTLSAIGHSRGDYVAFWHGDAIQYSCGHRLNLTGPFTYTKPTGYVAYDWTNEVA